MKSVLLSCSHLVGPHTSVNILSEFDDDLIDVSDLADEEVSSDLLDLLVLRGSAACPHTCTLGEGQSCFCSWPSFLSARQGYSHCNHVKKSVSATENIEKLFGKTLVSKNDTHRGDGGLYQEGE